MNFVVFLGPPGSGKGTQAQYLVAENKAIEHVATGQILRDEIASGSEFGQYIAKIVNQGDFVNDQLMFQIFEKKMEQKQKLSHVILDGIPRTVYQADLLESYVKKTRSLLKKVVYFDIDDQVLIERITGRYACAHCGELYHKVYKCPIIENQCDRCHETKFIQRDDDTLEVVQHRLKVYHDQTQALVEYYSDLDLLVKVDANQPVRQIVNQVHDLVNI